MGAFKLGKMTFGSLFKKPETVRYPVETKPQPAGLKGHIAIDVDDCILCGMCDRSCATGCISVDKNAGTWSIDRLQCVQCGYCITVCPKKCLSMNPNYSPATTVHGCDVVAVSEQQVPAKKEPAEAPTANAPSEKPATEALSPVASDRQVETLLAMMDPSQAEKVRAALR